MHTSFSNILALIGLSEDPAIYFTTAIQIANRFECNLQIIYRVGINDSENDAHQNERKLIHEQALLCTYRPILKSRLLLDIQCTWESVRLGAIKYGSSNGVGLILQWEKDESLISNLASLVQANMFSRKLGCPVLTLQKNTAVECLKDIVLPVNKSVPANKLIIGGRLAKLFNAKIHLISVVKGNRAAPKEGLFLKACSLLQDRGDIEVECKMLKGVSFYGTVMRYVGKLNSDTIMVCTGAKYGVLKSFGLHFTTWIMRSARKPVLTLPVEKMNVE